MKSIVIVRDRYASIYTFLPETIDSKRYTSLQTNGSLVKIHPKRWQQIGPPRMVCILFDSCRSRCSPTASNSLRAIHISKLQMPKSDLHGYNLNLNRIQKKYYPICYWIFAPHGRRKFVSYLWEYDQSRIQTRSRGALCSSKIKLSSHNQKIHRRSFEEAK